ncbi:DUF1217 domain-containing protein [Actibacterium mucosum]|nr:DUF1217 domain-containing protein [Actibacterium mucosum]
MFQPVVPFGGFAGWKFLERTREAQQTAHDNSAEIRRNSDYFRENIGKVTSVDGLIGDFRLMTVALGAFGLEDDINNRYFIRTVLSEGTLDPEALANRIANKSYAKMSEAFGFGDFATPNTQLSDFPEKIIEAYKTRQFEVAVGEVDNSMRLTLNLERELPDIINDTTSEETKWFSVMGSEPLRRVFENALGLPTSFAALDIDKQLEVFQDRAASTFGDASVSQFSDPENMEKLVRLHLVRSQIAADGFGFSSASTALTLLSSAVR